MQTTFQITYSKISKHKYIWNILQGSAESANSDNFNNEGREASKRETEEQARSQLESSKVIYSSLVWI